MKMNRTLILSAFISLCGALHAQDAPLTSAALNVESGEMTATMKLDLQSLGLGSNRSALLTPVVITAGGDSLALQPVTVYGRNRRIHAERLRQELPSLYFNSSDAPAAYDYSAAIPFTPALNGATLGLKVETFGCANCLKSVRWIAGPEWQMPEFVPALHVVYEVPEVTVTKETAMSGSAWVQFEVNKTDLLERFKNNRDELAKITVTIDSVKGDPDITLTSIFIKGFASPEGSYSNNRRLAKGRTAALKEWVENRYSFPADFIRTAYEPEDWEGLRKAIEAETTLPYRAGILEIINNESLEPDARDARLKQAYPEEYRHILNDIYPPLRHSDYRVEYTIRSYTSPEEILAVMEQNPAKLSPDEFFAAAQTLDPSSEHFRRVLETAARIHPDSQAANLNAASAALKGGDLKAAELYLSRAGNSPAAVYTRALLATELKDYAWAERLLQQASEAGYAKAAEILPQITMLKNINK